MGLIWYNQTSAEPNTVAVFLSLWKNVRTLTKKITNLFADDERRGLNYQDARHQKKTRRAYE
jgi:hypothetical protein